MRVEFSCWPKQTQTWGGIEICCMYRRMAFTYMVSLQEHQWSGPVLMQQLLYALVLGQCSLSYLLALYEASTRGYGLYHSLHTTGRILGHVKEEVKGSVRQED